MTIYKAVDVRELENDIIIIGEDVTTENRNRFTCNGNSKYIGYGIIVKGDYFTVNYLDFKICNYNEIEVNLC